MCNVEICRGRAHLVADSGPTTPGPIPADRLLFWWLISSLRGFRTSTAYLVIYHFLLSPSNDWVSSCGYMWGSRVCDCECALVSSSVHACSRSTRNDCWCSDFHCVGRQVGWLPDLTYIGQPSVTDFDCNTICDTKVIVIRYARLTAYNLSNL